MSFMNARRPRATPNTLMRHGQDTVSLNYFGSPMLASIGSDGRITGLSGAETTNQVAGEAVKDVDLAGLAADFAARDARGEGMGLPSARTPCPPLPSEYRYAPRRALGTCAANPSTDTRTWDIAAPTTPSESAHHRVR